MSCKVVQQNISLKIRRWLFIEERQVTGTEAGTLVNALRVAKIRSNLHTGQIRCWFHSHFEDAWVVG